LKCNRFYWLFWQLKYSVDIAFAPNEFVPQELLVLFLGHQVVGHRVQFLIVFLLKSVLELFCEVILDILGMMLPPDWAFALCWQLCHMVR
jgi:hypothetical protein